jgi:arylsulfatase A-like enzyme
MIRHQMSWSVRFGVSVSLVCVAVGAAALIGCAVDSEGTSEPARQPNIVVILADDLGYGDICGYSCVGLATPHIDSLGENGIRFTDGHVTAPVCSPSRAGFITGRYQQRFGHEFNAGAAQRAVQMGLGLPTTETTLADALRGAGYATGMVGKSHLGAIPKFHPMKRGFDEFFGFLHGGNLYMEPADKPGMHNAVTQRESFRTMRAKNNPILRGTTEVKEEEYLTDAFTREAVDFIERHSEKPFFLYLAYNAPHTPLSVTDEYYQRFPDIADEKKRIFAAMVSSVDDGVGRILATLKENELWEDTLVVFFSDNGCALYTEACFNDPLLGGKLMLFEGGQRVPFLMQYPRLLPKGVDYEHAVSALDIYPTALKLAGGTVPEDRDGVDLVPYLTGAPQTTPDRALFWRNGTNSAVRKGPWKLVNLGEGRHVLLYNVIEDIGETIDLAEKHPDKVKELSKLLSDWQSELVEPLWPTRMRIPFKEGDIEYELFV